MNKRPLLLAGGLVGVVIVGAIAWWLIAPIFFDRTVDEAFPFDLPTPTAAPAAAVASPLPPATPTAVATAPTDEPATATVPPTATLPEPTATPAEPIALRVGQFQPGERDYSASGTATLYQLPDGSHLLRFENFEATNGPDLRILLATNATPTTDADKGEFIDLGVLKGNIGNQNYEIAADIDLTQYQSVIIYCRAFSVLFATATLDPAS